MQGFTRAALAEMHKSVRQHFPSIRPMRDAWTHSTFNQFEFHGPEGFYWHGRAEDGWDARCKGWAAFLASKGVEGFAAERKRAPISLIVQKLKGDIGWRIYHDNEAEPERPITNAYRSQREAEADVAKLFKRAPRLKEIAEQYVRLWGERIGRIAIELRTDSEVRKFEEGLVLSFARDIIKEKGAGQ